MFVGQQGPERHRVTDHASSPSWRSSAVAHRPTACPESPPTPSRHRAHQVSPEATVFLRRAVAATPANNWTAHTFQHTWNAQAVFADGTDATLVTRDLEPLREAVLKGWEAGTFPCIAVNTTGGSDDDASSYAARLSTAERNLTVDHLGSSAPATRRSAAGSTGSG